MSIITKSQLSSFGSERSTFDKSINISLSESKNESSIGKVTIFLSHKHDENEELDNAIRFLKKFNVDVYVDWQDEGMPKSTSGVTATKIKGQIRSNDKFIFLATEGAIKSKWCNWELGYGDARKYIEHIAILPISDNYSKYSGAEYLSIYPHIYNSDLTPGKYFCE